MYVSGHCSLTAGGHDEVTNDAEIAMHHCKADMTRSVLHPTTAALQLDIQHLSDFRAWQRFTTNPLRTRDRVLRQGTGG